MDDLLDLVVNDEAPLKISDKIKEILFTKSAEKIDGFRPEVADVMFGNDFESDNEEE